MSSLFAPDDPSRFHDPVIEGIWLPGYRDCILSNRPATEKHHVFGRGQEFGIKPNDPRRILFSSPFNCCLLSHGSHTSALINDTFLRQALAWFVYPTVQNAIRRGDYEMTENDIAFLELVGMV